MEVSVCGLWRRVTPALLMWLLVMPVAHAARISELTETTMLDRAIRFFSFSDPSLRFALAGSILLGICCGLMGAFLVVRKLALMGDALSHAVLPGVALGFLWNLTRDPIAIFVGAVAAGLLGAGTVQVIRQTTRHKEDAALGFVLASFYAVGICLFTMIQNLPGGNRSGLDSFMFGQAAAMGPGDVTLLAVVTALALGTVLLFYKELKLTSFDPGFGRSTGLKVQYFHYGLMLLLAFSIVASLQAVGVVLVSAMLVIPAAAAYLLTDRFGIMLVVAAVFGMGSGAIGAFFSFVGRSLPTGPLMVLAATAVFLLALLFAPRHGVVSKWWRLSSRSSRVRRENTLKAMYQVLEANDFSSDQITVKDLAERRRETLDDIERQLAKLKHHGLATISSTKDAACFTPAGWQRACEIVRNHRLWELYLTNAAHIAPDHVHNDAEEIEHILGEANVQALERRLNFSRKDPHGRIIPGIEDIHAGRTLRESTRATGFGGKDSR